MRSVADAGSGRSNDDAGDGERHSAQDCVAGMQPSSVVAKQQGAQSKDAQRRGQAEHLERIEGMVAKRLCVNSGNADRQKRAVTKMALIEDKGSNFEELEMFEDAMPGSAGWSLIAKASRDRQICGGVVADAIGAGSE